MFFSTQHAHRPLLALALAIAPAWAGAQTTYTWTGAISGDWGTPGNWSPDGVPGTGMCNSSGVCDMAVFGLSAHTAITLVEGNNIFDVSLTFQSNAPAYTITSAYGDLILVDGITNLARTTHPTIVIGGQGAGSNVTVFGGTLANSTVVNYSGLGLIAPAAEDGATVVMQPSGILYVAGYEPATTPIVTIGSLSGAGNVYMASYPWILGELGHNDTFGGVLVDGGGPVGIGGTGAALTKTGNGMLTLTGANTYTGTTTVQSGTLQIDGSLASGETLVDTGASLGGAGSIGDLAAQAASLIIPGNANPNTTLSAGTLLCANSPIVQERIGDVGSSTHGTYLSLSQPLQSGFCPHLHFRFTSAGVPLVAGQSYLLVSILGATDYSTSNVDFDFNSFPGYPQATGNFSIGNFGSVSFIFFQLSSPGDKIFANGFELFN